MKVSDLYRVLSYGVLSNLAIANDGDGTIREDSHRKMVHYTNQALLKLYSRFIIKESSLILELVDRVTNYHLLAKFSEVNNDPDDPTYPYIKDLPAEPFKGDVLKVLNVYNSDGEELPLNDINDPKSVFTPQFNIIQIPGLSIGTELAVIYQAKHETVPNSDLNFEIFIPDVLVEALTYYIAYQVYNAMNGTTATTKAANYLNLYDRLVADTVSNDILSTSLSSTDAKFLIRGFV